MPSSSRRRSSDRGGAARHVHLRDADSARRSALREAGEKRSSRIRRSRSSSAWRPRLERVRSSARSYPDSSAPIVARPGSPSSRAARRAGGPYAARAPGSPRAPARGVARSPPRSPAIVGERPSCRQALDRRGRRARSAPGAPRGTRTAQALVAEVALDLADDRRRRVRREAQLALRSKRSTALIRPIAADLLEVVERLAAVGVAARERAHERQVALHERPRASGRRPRGSACGRTLAIGPSAGEAGRRYPRTAFSRRTTSVRRRPPRPRTSRRPSERIRGSVSSPRARAAGLQRACEAPVAERSDARADALLAATRSRERDAGPRDRLRRAGARPRAGRSSSSSKPRSSRSAMPPSTKSGSRAPSARPDGRRQVQFDRMRVRSRWATGSVAGIRRSSRIQSPCRPCMRHAVCRGGAVKGSASSHEVGPRGSCSARGSAPAPSDSAA